jgi:hypothetical protein
MSAVSAALTRVTTAAVADGSGLGAADPLERLAGGVVGPALRCVEVGAAGFDAALVLVLPLALPPLRHPAIVAAPAAVPPTSTT